MVVIGLGKNLLLKSVLGHCVEVFFVVKISDFCFIFGGKIPFQKDGGFISKIDTDRNAIFSKFTGLNNYNQNRYFPKHLGYFSLMSPGMASSVDFPYIQILIRNWQNYFVF